MNTRKAIGRSKEAKARKTLTVEQQFFFDHAGYSYGKDESLLDGRVRCAKALATAERYVADNTKWGFCWEYDDAGCSGCDCKSPYCKCSTGEAHETLCCLVRDTDGRVLASLGGICSPDPHYSRVIEAELAEEAIEAMREHGAKVNA